MKNFFRPTVTDDLRIIGLPLAPIAPDAAIHLATALLRKASQRLVLDEVRVTARRQKSKGAKNAR